jgi:hypothetical protein
MFVGRGRAYDALHPDEADGVRLLIRQVREDKGLTNEDLADALHWRKTTRVVAMLSYGRPLRRVNAVELLRAVRRTNVQGLRPDARTRADEANKKIDLVLPGLEKPVLSAPALIAAQHIPVIAGHLADIVSKLHPGMDKKRRARLASDLERALKQVAPEMAYMFCQLFTVSPNRKTIQWMVSGYQKQFETMGVIFEEKS